LRPHPHVHAIATRGGWDRDGTWHPVPYLDEHAAERLFRHKVIKLLRDAGLLDQRRIELLLSWKHTGFSARGETHIGPTDRKMLEVVARYLLRCPISLARLVWREGASIVVYKGQHGEADQEIDACELIARLLAHIPDPRKHLVFYFGAYSNVARGRRKKSDVSLGVAGDTDPDQTSAAQAARRRSWAELIRRVYEVDPLLCPKCGSDMRIIAFITDPSVMKKILDHIRDRHRVGRAPPAVPSAAVPA